MTATKFIDSPWWMRILEKQGLATLLVLFCCYLGWTLGGQLVSGHIQFLDQQVEAIGKLCDVQERQQMFWDGVGETHRKQTELIELNGQRIEQVSVLMSSAHALMKDAPEQRKQMVEQLTELNRTLKDRNN